MTGEHWEQSTVAGTSLFTWDKPKLQVSRFTTISGAVNPTLWSWYMSALHESKAALAQKQPVPEGR